MTALEVALSYSGGCGCGDVDAAPRAVAAARLTSMARVIMGSTFIALTAVSRTHTGKATEQTRCRHQAAADGEEERFQVVS
jgi:hypothetical protein